MLKFWEIHKKDAYYIGKDGEKVFHTGYHIILSFYPDGVSEIINFRTGKSEWKFYLEDKDNFYTEEEEPIFYA